MGGYFKDKTALYNRISDLSKSVAKELAKEAGEKLTDKYISLISDFYEDYPTRKYNPTWNLYNSHEKYYSDSRNRYVYGGFKVSATKMSNYPAIPGIRKKEISAGRLLEKFIYNPDGTWHGGDFHGGYGEEASFSIYKELDNYRKDLIDEFRDRCRVG